MGDLETPSLHALAPHHLRRPAATDASPYEGHAWNLEFRESLESGPIGPRRYISILLKNTGRGGANAIDGSQHALLQALTDKFVPVFRNDSDFKWVVHTDGSWNTNCTDKTHSFGHWRFYTDLMRDAAKATASDGRVSLIPGGTTFNYLKKAFDAPMGLVRVVELAGLDYQWLQNEGMTANEGAFVVWTLAQPSGKTDFVRRHFLGGGGAGLMGRR